MAKVEFKCENCSKVVYPDYLTKKLTDGTTQHEFRGHGVSIVVVTNGSTKQDAYQAMKAFCDEYKRKINPIGRLPKKDLANKV